MRCPDPLQLEAFVDGELPADAAVSLARHLAGCPRCSDRVEKTRRLIALLQTVPASELGEAEARWLVESVKRRAGRPTGFLRSTWRRSLAAAAVVLALGVGTLTYRTALIGQPFRAVHPLTQALLNQHQGYEAVLAADPGLNVQVAWAGQ